MPEGMPELPTAPFGRKKSRGNKDDNEGEYEVPKMSMDIFKKARYKETGKLNVKKTVEGAAIRLGLLAGAEAVAAWGGGPVEAIGVGAVLGSALRPHAVYEKKKNVNEVL